MSERHYVFIPMVEPGKKVSSDNRRQEPVTSSQLLEVYTQFSTFGDEENRELDNKALEKDWDRIAAPLRKVGLYQPGCVAASAIHKLGLKRPKGAFYQLLRPQAWIESQRLHAASPQGSIEGQSAELGLAISLLMGASRTHYRHVFATGALSKQPGVKDQDVEVLPVGRLREKLKLVLNYSREKRVIDKKLLFFMPTHFQDGGKPIPVQQLPEVQQLSQLGVKVVAVTWLSEAAQALGAKRARYVFGDRLFQLFIGSLIVLGLLVSSWFWWQRQPIPMIYLAGGPSAPAAEPFQVCFTGNGGYYPLPLRQQGISRTIPTNETLGWKIRVGSSNGLHGKLATLLGQGGYYVAQIMISEFSKSKVVVPRHTDQGEVLRILPGEIWEWAWELNDRAESNGLVLLAQAHRPFNPDALRDRLLERFPQATGSGDSKQGGLDVTAAVNFMSTQAPGAVKFIMQTAEGGSRCKSGVMLPHMPNTGA